MAGSVRTLENYSPDSVLEEIGKKEAEEMLFRMMQIRRFEEKAMELYSLGKIHGTMHLSNGQEATAVGGTTAMDADDYLLNTHRGHGHCLGWGSDPKLMMAEFMGKESGYCRGRGGSMHIADVDANNLGANGIVGGGLPISVGVGLSIKQKKSGQSCLTIFGDGAANEGAFHEALNMASIWDLPIIYLCENNQYAMSMSVEKAFKIEQISERAAAYNIAGVTVDGNDVLAVYEAVRQAKERAEKGHGPTLVECVTYRYMGHSKSDRQAYRTREEVKDWIERDPIERFAKLLKISKAKKEKLYAQAEEIIEQSVAFAEDSPEPRVDTIMEGVYA